MKGREKKWVGSDRARPIVDWRKEEIISGLDLQNILNLNKATLDMFGYHFRKIKFLFILLKWLVLTLWK